MPENNTGTKRFLTSLIAKVKPMPNATAPGTVLCVLLLAGASLGQEEKKETNKPEGTWAHSKPEAGITLSAWVAAKIEAGTPIPITIELANKGTDLGTLAINRRSDFHVEFKVVDEKGKKVPLTRYGVTRLKPVEIGDILAKANGAFNLRRLKPGKSMDFGIANLGLYYDLTVPGAYAVTVSQGVRIGTDDEHRDVQLKTPPLRFTIERP